MFEPLSSSPSAIGTGWLSFNLTAPLRVLSTAKSVDSIVQAGLATLLRFENFVFTPDNRTDNS
jgi:hypothetical protein